MKSLHLIHHLCCLAAVVVCSEFRQESKPSSLLPLPGPEGQSLLFSEWLEVPKTVDCPAPDTGDKTPDIHTFEIAKSRDEGTGGTISLKEKDSDEVHHMTWQNYQCFAAWGDQTLMLCPDPTMPSFFLRVADGYTEEGELKVVCQTTVNLGVQ